MASWEHFNAFKSLQIRQRGREIPESGARSTANSHNTLPEENAQAGRSDDSSDSSDNASDGSSPDTTTSSSSSGARVLRNGERHPIQILELETANFIRDLFSQADLLSVEEPRENRRGPPLEIGYPYNSLLLIRQKLVHFAEQESTAAQLRYDIHSLLRILLPTIWDTHESSIVGIDTIASQSTIIARGKVKFSELATLFLPGELVYSETIDASRELAYEQCCVVASCENESFRSRRAVRIRATKWVWCKRSLSISLSSSEVMTITEYPGERNICVSKLGIVPLKVMSEDNMLQIRNRLIVRGKNYVETFRIEGSSWEYSGPTSGSLWQSIIDLVSLKDAELGVWSTFNQFDATMRTRVLLAPVLQQEFITDDDRTDAHDLLKSTNQLSDETYLICSGKARVWNVLSGRQMLVQVDKLQPVVWDTKDTERLKGGIAEPSDQALSVIQEAFLFKTDTPNRVVNSCQGFIVSVRASNSRDITQQIDAMAEREKRIHLCVDFLDYQNVPHDSPDHGDMLQFLQLGVKTGVILSFYNIAPLLKKRTFNNRHMCERITNFITRLKSYPGAIFIFLGLKDQTDPAFDLLQPREIRIN